MIYRDLRSFLEALEAESQLLTIADPVMPEPDIGAAVRALNNLGEGMPAVSFTNVTGYPGAHIAMNVHGSWANHAIMMGLPKATPVKEQFFEFARRWEDHPVDVERSETAPFQDVSITEDINLFDILPLFRLNQFDGGFYIGKASVVTRDPNDPDHFGKQNVGIYRMQIKGRDRIGVLPSAFHDMGIHLRLAEERGENLPVCIAIGCDPIMSLVAATPLAHDQSEYEMAGALQGAPYRIVKASLSDCDIPWGAEYVIEGEVLCGVRESEGPFGEFTGHYSGGRAHPVIQVNKVLHRREPIFEHLYLGMPWTEIDYLLGLSTCVPIDRQLKQNFPAEIVAVNAMYTHGLVTIISTKQRYGGFAKAVGMSAMTIPHGLGYCKFVIMVDADVDPFNLPQVMWAVSTKVQPGHDITILPNLGVVPLDPGSDPPGLTDKVIIDATTPITPDIRGYYTQPLEAPSDTREWEKRLAPMLEALAQGKRGQP